MTAIADIPTGSQKKRVPVLDGIRGVCALGVLFTHVAFATFVQASNASENSRDIWAILAAGQLSLGPFFVLSGLLLYRPFARRAFGDAPRPALGKFYLRRASRILPAFWLVVTVDLVLLNASAITGVWDVLRPYLLLHIYDFHYYAGMDVLWTVPTEIQFYALLPVLAWVMHRLAKGVADPAAKARRMIAPLGVFVAAEYAWTIYIHGAFEMWPSQYFYPLSVCSLFAIGMAMAVWSAQSEVSERPAALHRAALARPGLFWLGALAFYALNCAQPFSTPGTSDWLSPEAAVIRHLCMFFFSFLIMVPLVVPGATTGYMKNVLGNPVLVFLGRISYGIYLWHFTVMYFRFESGSVFGEIVPVQMLIGKFGFWDLFLTVTAGTIVLSTLSYYLFEQPIIRFVEKRVKWRGQPPVEDAAPQRAPAGV
ncbi:acyltransferase [Actinocorallia sp. A-T 12471]|uniref:acyltransferase family protein n=1 Tax=Actinocorallia sp. A-T 12471 TaxID=3089813 RepID=UPI0029D3AA5E|nr:acyltransferase [Actinocorallia sp. A-T 12471]MDX6741593.1 acyltransferase [Actinocorallia sp. A-T 12471]